MALTPNELAQCRQLYSDQDLLAMALAMLRQCDKRGYKGLGWLRNNRTIEVIEDRVIGNPHAPG